MVSIKFLVSYPCLLGLPEALQPPMPCRSRRLNHTDFQPPLPDLLANTSAQIYVYAYMFTYLYIYIYMYMYVYICTHTFIHICMRTVPHCHLRKVLCVAYRIAFQCDPLYCSGCAERMKPDVFEN